MLYIGCIHSILGETVAIMTTESQNQLGKIIDEARKRRGLSIRAIARDMEVTHGYVRDLIHGHRVPSEAVIRKLCRVLELNYDELMTLAGRVGESVNRHARSSIRYGQFIRRLADERVTDEEIDDLTEHFLHTREKIDVPDRTATQEYSTEQLELEQQMLWSKDI